MKITEKGPVFSVKLLKSIIYSPTKMEYVKCVTFV
jgi:hypothetical protein